MNQPKRSLHYIDALSKYKNVNIVNRHGSSFVYIKDNAYFVIHHNYIEFFNVSSKYVSFIVTITGCKTYFVNHKLIASEYKIGCFRIIQHHMEGLNWVYWLYHRGEICFTIESSSVSVKNKIWLLTIEKYSTILWKLLLLHTMKDTLIIGKKLLSNGMMIKAEQKDLVNFGITDSDDVDYYKIIV